MTRLLNTLIVLTDNQCCPAVKTNSVGVLLDKKDYKYKIYFIGQDITAEGLESHFFEVIELKDTGDEFERKICDRCFLLKDTQMDFENNRIKKGGKITKRPSCRPCRTKNNGINIPLKVKAEWLKRKPKLGELFTCPICNKKSLGGMTRHVLDHNHKSGEVRGYLCESCNTGIGRFDDDIHQIENAIEWVRKKSDS